MLNNNILGVDKKIILEGGGCECGIGLNWFILYKSRLRVRFCENCNDHVCYGRRLCQFNLLALWEGSDRLSATSVFCAVPRVLTVGVLSCPLNAGRALPVPLLAAHRIQTDNFRLNSPPIIRNSLRTHRQY